LSLDVVGTGVGNPSSRPWEILGDYDLVFASGRSALEALAVGAAVIVCNHIGLGPMVTAAEFDWLRSVNFGYQATLRRPFSVDEALRQIERYDAADAAEVSRRIRSSAGLEATVDRLLDLYAEVIAEHQRTPPCPKEETRAAAAYLRQLSGRLKTYYQLQRSHDQLQEWRDRLVQLVGSLQSELDWVHQSLTWRWRERITQVRGPISLYRFARRWFF
jgi:hypothetical protein